MQSTYSGDDCGGSPDRRRHGNLERPGVSRPRRAPRGPGGVSEEAALAALVDIGAFRVTVQERFALDDVADACRRVEAGGVRGKVVVVIGPH